MNSIRKEWNDIDIGSRHLIILVPFFFVFMFVNTAIYQAIHNMNEPNIECGGFNVSYIDAFQYLQTVAFTIGYGHISPLCSGGRIYTFAFAYFTIPLVVYIFTLSGRKIADLVSTSGSKVLKAIAHPLLRDVLIMLLLDFFIFIAMMIIPAAIVPTLPSDYGEPYSYGDHLWYVFASVTTIGFGDVIGGLADSDSTDPNVHHITNFYWVAKMGFLMVALSFMASSLMIKYQMVVDHIYGPMPLKSGRRKLFDDDTANDGIEATDRNSS